MLTRRLMLSAAGALAAPGVIRAQSTSAPIVIGEINSYTAQPAFTLPYRNGWQLALELQNAAGGLLGRKLEVVSRDDAGRPQDAVRIAGELVNDAKVDVLAGTFLSNVGLAVSDYALTAKKLFVAGEPLTDALIWDKGNRYTFRLRPGTYEQSAMLVEQAAKLPAKRWATVAPNYEYGQSAVKWFKQLLSAKRPDVEFVAEQWPALGRIDAGATVGALAQPRPDAIFNVTFGADLTNFVRTGNDRGLFEHRAVASMLTGEPEYLDPLGDETPEGWIVTGYPHELAGDAGAQELRHRLSRQVRRHAALRLGSRLRADQRHRRRHPQNRPGGQRSDGGRLQGRRVRDPVRPCFVPVAGPSIDAGRLRRQAGGQGRPRHDAGLALRGRRRSAAARRRGQDHAPRMTSNHCGSGGAAPGGSRAEPSP